MSFPPRCLIPYTNERLEPGSAVPNRGREAEGMHLCPRNRGFLGLRFPLCEWSLASAASGSAGGLRELGHPPAAVAGGSGHGREASPLSPAVWELGVPMAEPVLAASHRQPSAPGLDGARDPLHQWLCVQGEQRRQRPHHCRGLYRGVRHLVPQTPALPVQFLTLRWEGMGALVWMLRPWCLPAL